MYPHERSLVKQYKDAPFALIGVNSDRNLEYAKKAVADNQLDWRSFWAGPKGTNGPIPKSWNVGSWPALFVIDHKGVIRYRGSSQEQLDKAIARWVAVAKKDNGGKKQAGK